VLRKAISIQKRAKAVGRLAAVILLSHLDRAQPATPHRSRAGGIILRLPSTIVVLSFARRWRSLSSLRGPYVGFPSPVILDFPRGTSTAAIADDLAEAGVIRYLWQFLVAWGSIPTRD
jgi:hypothetical protein